MLRMWSTVLQAHSGMLMLEADLCGPVGGIRMRLLMRF